MEKILDSVHKKVALANGKLITAIIKRTISIGTIRTIAETYESASADMRALEESITNKDK